jgi:ATP-binding cassette subfamily B protein
VSLALEPLLWSTEDIHRGVETLLAMAGFPMGADRIPKLSMKGGDAGIVDWLVNAPRRVGLEGSFEGVPKFDLLERLTRTGPIVSMFPLYVEGGVEVRFLAVLSNGLSCTVLAPNDAEIVVRPAELFDAIDELTQEKGGALRSALADLNGGREALDALYREARFDAYTFSVVRYRRDGAASISEQLAALRGRGLAWRFVVLSVLELAISSAAALTLGRAAMDGIVDHGRIMAWAMLSLVNVPLTYWSTSMLGSFTIVGGLAVKRRLLEGAFFADDRTLRAQGYGSTLARLNEASVVERTSLAEVFALVTPLGMWLAAAWLFASTRLALALIGIQLAAMAFVLAVSWRLVRAYTSSYAQRLAITEDLIDKVVGHRTRAIQEGPSQRHDEEDRRLSEYLSTLSAQDRLFVALSTAGRLFLVGAGAVLAVAFVGGAGAEELLAAGVGIFLGVQALNAASVAVERGVGWLAAWRAIRPLFIAGRERDRPHRDLETEGAAEDLPTVLAASAVSFSYREGGRVILREADLRVRRGERILIEGRSGGGKSTFAKLVAGELRPSSGSLLVGGLDASTISQGQWRMLVASTPQFHENHLFSNTFAFNIDPVYGHMGLRPTARAMCEELGLGEVLARMPAGAAQLLGETGWQLSHGERSRVFVARALLQDAKIVIFDESFGALDPVTMDRVVACVRRRAATVLVIAHV